MVKVRVVVPCRRHFSRAILLFARGDSTPGHGHYSFIVELSVVAFEVLLNRILIILLRINTMPVDVEHMLPSSDAAIELHIAGFSPSALLRWRPELLMLLNTRVIYRVVRSCQRGAPHKRRRQQMML